MQEALTAQCVHHWVLGVPEDEVVRGRCKLCGAVREYPAALELAAKPAAAEETPPPAVLADIEAAPTLLAASA